MYNTVVKVSVLNRFKGSQAIIVTDTLTFTMAQLRSWSLAQKALTLELSDESYQTETVERLGRKIGFKGFVGCSFKWNRTILVLCVRSIFTLRILTFQLTLRLYYLRFTVHKIYLINAPSSKDQWIVNFTVTADCWTLN